MNPYARRRAERLAPRVAPPPPPAPPAPPPPNVWAVIESLPGWCSLYKARRLARIVIDSRARTVVEMGVYGGRSLIALAHGLRTLGGGHADGIDPYSMQAVLEGEHTESEGDFYRAMNLDWVLAEAQHGIWRAGVQGFASITRARSLDPVSTYEDGSIDVIHQDANHAEGPAIAEVRAWTPKLRPGGIWIFDDTDWPSTEAAQRLLIELGFTRTEDHVESVPRLGGGAWAVFVKGS